MTVNLLNCRHDFPIFKQLVRGQRLAYLDSAATTQKPHCVIDKLSQYYQTCNANVHRGVHYLSEQATQNFIAARQTVQKFINAKKLHECIFVKSTTEAINLVAQSFGDAFIQKNDEIVITMMEHHSNIVPWQMLCKRKEAHLKFIPMTNRGVLDLESLDSLFTEKTKLLSISHVSNALGTIHPIKEIIKKAQARNIPVFIDGAQAAAHIPIDVQDLDCDFYTFSSHKVYGPMGVGVLYGKEKWLEKMPPYQGGGDMIKKVSLSETLYQDLPYKFEAGTPAVAEAIALKSALDYLMNIGFESIAFHENELLKIATEALTSMPSVRIIGHSSQKVGIISFLIDNIHSHDLGTLVDQKGVAIRTGHHCAMPLMDFLGLTATARLSLGLYNTEQDIEQFLEALTFAKKFFKIKDSVCL